MQIEWDWPIHMVKCPFSTDNTDPGNKNALHVCSSWYSVKCLLIHAVLHWTTEDKRQQKTAVNGRHKGIFESARLSFFFFSLSRTVHFTQAVRNGRSYRLFAPSIDGLSRGNSAMGHSSRKHPRVEWTSGRTPKSWYFFAECLNEAFKCHY